ncbi:hypothetical protein M413DRAFT_443099 [Hebeloma cylindrosporum]|uniref:Uncharacterized protein n=1 Tax=Hebeloma cylindrosporum TaxID=76867 RepID=A0A0C3CIQ2_HEBCY|nr:hypothetical protein M413DRAFT_443099 [Hebeloma cylindrosporum h7]
MANFIDILSLVATITVFGGVIYGVIFVMRSINEGVASTKESLKSRGLDVSASGVSIKTSKRFDREDYVDATQRGIVRAVGAASFKRNASPSSGPGKLEREASNSSSKSTGSEEKKKKKSAFGSRK